MLPVIQEDSGRQISPRGSAALAQRVLKPFFPPEDTEASVYNWNSRLLVTISSHPEKKREKKKTYTTFFAASSVGKTFQCLQAIFGDAETYQAIMATIGTIPVTTRPGVFFATSEWQLGGIRMYFW